MTQTACASFSISSMWYHRNVLGSSRDKECGQIAFVVRTVRKRHWIHQRVDTLSAVMNVTADELKFNRKLPTFASSRNVRNFLPDYAALHSGTHSSQPLRVGSQMYWWGIDHFQSVVWQVGNLYTPISEDSRLDGYLQGFYHLSQCGVKFTS
jgi:hypothetical protein